jgi:hypothetical protein
MKPQISTGKPARQHYGVASPAYRLRPPNTLFRDSPPPGSDLDDACWIETAGRGAVEIRSIADHRGDDE